MYITCATITLPPHNAGQEGIEPPPRSPKDIMLLLNYTFNKAIRDRFFYFKEQNILFKTLHESIFTCANHCTISL